ncbi:MAG: PorV/PorQ family protein [Elusimicrobiota bacterium]
MFAFMFLLPSSFFPLSLHGWFSSGTSGYPGEYLVSLSGGAEGMGMGNAQTSLEGHSSLMYSNPASLATLWWQEGSMTVMPLFFQAQYIFMSYGYPLDEKNFTGFGFARLSSGDAEKTNELGETTGSFSDQETAVFLNYSRKEFPDFLWGVNLKLVSQEIDTFSAKGAGLDAGLIYYTAPEHAWSLNLINLVPPRLGPDVFPLVAKTGFKRSLFKNKLAWNTDLSFIFTEKYFSSWATGAEYKITDFFKVRFGVNVKQVSAGFGLSTRQIDIDYSFTYHPLDFLHCLTLSLRYGVLPSVAEQKIKDEFGRLSEEKERYIERSEKLRDDIKFERERLKKERKLSMQFLDAKYAFEEKRYSQSRKILENILKEDPASAEARKLLDEISVRQDDATIKRKLSEAAGLYSRGLYSEATASVNYVLENLPENLEAQILGYLINAHLYLNDKKFNDAKGELIEVLKIDMNNREATLLLKRIQTIMEVQGK